MQCSIVQTWMWILLKKNYKLKYSTFVYRYVVATFRGSPFEKLSFSLEYEFSIFFTTPSKILLQQKWCISTLIFVYFVSPRPIVTLNLPLHEIFADNCYISFESTPVTVNIKQQNNAIPVFCHLFVFHLPTYRIARYRKPLRLSLFHSNTDKLPKIMLSLF